MVCVYGLGHAPALLLPDLPGYPGLPWATLGTRRSSTSCAGTWC